MNRMDRVLLTLAMLTCVVGCASTRPAPPPHLGRTVAVLLPNNLTGDPLIVAGAGVIDRYIRHAQQVDIRDILLSEARFQLLNNGFEVVDRYAVATAVHGATPASPESAAALASQGGIDALVLYLEIRRWEPDAPVHTAFVIVGLSASLVDPASRRVVWQEERRPAPVATPGEITVESAYVTAARKVIAQMLAPLRPDPAVPPKP
jgi:hypothetical protein